MTAVCWFPRDLDHLCCMLDSSMWLSSVSVWLWQLCADSLETWIISAVRLTQVCDCLQFLCDCVYIFSWTQVRIVSFVLFLTRRICTAWLERFMYCCLVHTWMSATWSQTGRCTVVSSGMYIYCFSTVSTYSNQALPLLMEQQEGYLASHWGSGLTWINSSLTCIICRKIGQLNKNWE